ncbi:MAG: PepSY domain-containing protein [Acidobacteriia bacterium]|nr:PepSY domain-containing protein [Terriglobia bacterium]
MLILVKKTAILCHRWMGVAFCLLFAWWFVSGIFMMYWDYPSVSDADRLERAPFLDPAQVKISAADAWAKADSDQTPNSIRLASFDGRPAYYFRTGRSEAMVYADTGEQQDLFPSGLNLRTAAAWSGQPAGAATVDEVTRPDQWTLEGGLRNLRPLWKYSWPNGDQVYVSENTGEVVQFTTRSSRFFAHLGPIPHWLYYTPLRKNGPLWSKVVIWLSGIATIAALMGLVVGLMMYSPSRRVSIPYTGQKRLHHILGLFFGIVACTWAFSGMLSMEPFPLSSGRPQQGRSIAAALRGKRPPLSQYAMKPPQEALAQLGPAFQVKQLEFSSFASEPVYLATGARGETRVIRMRGEPLESFNTGRILNVLNSVARVAEARLITQYDAYYLDRNRQRPLPVLFVQLNDEAHSRYYIDPKTAQVVGSYRASTESWVNRWLYHGLHSVNFPWLYNYRPAWDIVVLTLMLGGTSLCVTSVIIGFQLVRRKLIGRRAMEASLLKTR